MLMRKHFRELHTVYILNVINISNYIFYTPYFGELINRS